MKGDTIGSTNLHLVCGDRLLVGAVHADMEINEYSSRKGVFNHTLQVNLGTGISIGLHMALDDVTYKDIGDMYYIVYSFLTAESVMKHVFDEL